MPRRKNTDASLTPLELGGQPLGLLVGKAESVKSVFISVRPTFPVVSAMKRMMAITPLPSFIGRLLKMS